MTQSYKITLLVIAGLISLFFIVVAVIYCLYKKYKQPSSVNVPSDSVSYQRNQEYTPINCLDADGENRNGGLSTTERGSDINGSISHHEQS